MFCLQIEGQTYRKTLQGQTNFAEWFPPGYVITPSWPLAYRIVKRLPEGLVGQLPEPCQIEQFIMREANSHGCPPTRRFPLPLPDPFM
jgi:hypothetical protein